MIPQNMIPFLNDVARQFLRDYDENAPANGTNVEFVVNAAATDSLTTIMNYNYFIAFGRIWCQLGEQSYENQRQVMVHCADLRAQAFEGSLSSSMEMAFFQLMVPEMVELTGRPLNHLFPEPYVRRTCRTASALRLVTIFYCPVQMCGRGLLDSLQMEEMACAIGEFHAYSFQMRRRKPEFGSEGAFLRTTFRPANRIVERLRQCLELLRQRPCCLADSPESQMYRNGANGIEELLNDFDARLQRAFDRKEAGHCWVLCHQNFSETSVVFSGEEPRRIVKVFNWHSVGFASLAVDLVIWLFTECRPDLRYDTTLVDFTVALYHQKLLTTFVNRGVPSNVPSMNAIVEQVRMCIPVALYVLANRALYMEPRVQPEDEVHLENENRILEVYEQLIRLHYV